MRILVVEDDSHVADALEFALRQHGHEVTVAGTGDAALQYAQTAEFILLDLGLPDLDGQEVCRRIRAGSPVPIIVLTARADELDRVIGLQTGADDYVVKPYSLRELLARIEAVSRRGLRAHPQGTADADSIQVGPLVIDQGSRQVRLAGVALRLTRKEFDLLALLASQAGLVCGREDIINQVWDENWFGPTRTLDVHVGALRTKLGDTRWIETLRGVGFRLVDPAGW